jgi:hypothetical protein
MVGLGPILHNYFHRHPEHNWIKWTFIIAVAGIFAGLYAIQWYAPGYELPPWPWNGR